MRALKLLCVLALLCSVASAVAPGVGRIVIEDVDEDEFPQQVVPPASAELSRSWRSLLPAHVSDTALIWTALALVAVLVWYFFLLDRPAATARARGASAASPQTEEEMRRLRLRMFGSGETERADDATTQTAKKTVEERKDTKPVAQHTQRDKRAEIEEAIERAREQQQKAAKEAAAKKARSNAPQQQQPPQTSTSSSSLTTSARTQKSPPATAAALASSAKGKEEEEGVGVGEHGDDDDLYSDPSLVSSTKEASAKEDASSNQDMMDSFALQDIFQVTAYRSMAKHFPTYEFLPLLADELEKETPPGVLGARHVRSILFERRRKFGPLPMMVYLYECFVRATEQKPCSANLQRLVQGYIVSQAVFEVQDCAVASGGRDDILLALLQEPPNPDYCMAKFVAGMAAEMKDSPSKLASVFGGSFAGALTQMSRLKVLDCWEMPCAVVSYLVQDAQLAKLLVDRQDFIPASVKVGRLFEDQSYLGAFFRASVTKDEEIVRRLFPAQSDANQTDNMLLGRRVQNKQQRALVRITQQLLKHPQSRDATLEWFRKVAELNLVKCKMVFDAESASTDGFLLNCVGVLCRAFSEEASRLHSEDVSSLLDPVFWLKFGGFAGWIDSTSLSSFDSEAVTQFRKSLSSAVSLSDRPTHYMLNMLFFMALNLMHSTFTGMIATLRRMQEVEYAYRREIRAVEESRHEWEAGPGRALMEQRLRGLNEYLAGFRGTQLAFNCQIFDPEFCEAVLNVHNVFCSMVLRASAAADANDGVGEMTASSSSTDQLSLSSSAASSSPSPSPSPLSVAHLAFASLPEFLVSDMITFADLVISNQVVTSGSQLRSMIDFLIRLVQHPRRISNTYLRGELAKTLCMLPLHAFEANVAVERGLAAAMVSAWVAVEVTGRHGQYFEKLNFRQYIINLFKKLARVTWWDQSVRGVWKKDPKLFVRFCYMLLGDLEYLLDDAFTRLARVAALERDMEDRIAWGSRPVDERNLLEQELKENLRFVSALCEFSSSGVEMVQYLGDLTPDALLCSELVDRTACLLSFFIRRLVGPKYNELNVRNPERFKFNPKPLLQQLMSVYLKLGRQSEAFCECLAADLRSFIPEEFRQGLTLMRAHGLSSAADLDAFGQLIDKVEASRKQANESEAEEDVPEEFLDELMGSVMTDPVTLPSGKILDRSTVMRHLLANPTDPYTRAPLSADMLKDNTELKERIDKWRNEKKTKKK